MDSATLDTSRAFLSKLRDTLLADNGVKPSNVKVVPLPSNTATCEGHGPGGQGPAGRGPAGREM